MDNRRTLIFGILSFIILILIVISFVLSMFSVLNKKIPQTHINTIKQGAYRIILLNNKPVGIFRPTLENVKELSSISQQVLNHKQIHANQKVFVYYLISTNKGCGLTHAPKSASPKAIFTSNKDIWIGGFFDMCHYGEWDYAGRAVSVYDKHNGLPDLKSPRYIVKNDKIYWIGE